MRFAVQRLPPFLAALFQQAALCCLSILHYTGKQGASASSLDLFCPAAAAPAPPAAPAPASCAPAPATSSPACGLLPSAPLARGYPAFPFPPDLLRLLPLLLLCLLALLLLVPSWLLLVRLHLLPLLLPSSIAGALSAARRLSTGLLCRLALPPAAALLAACGLRGWRLSLLPIMQHEVITCTACDARHSLQRMA